jgi:hypothetical protein
LRPIFAIAILLTAAAVLSAEEPIQIPHRNVPAVESAALQLPVSWPILRDSAKIFSGTVLQVEHRNSDSSSALATTKIRFHVDQAIRGVSRGQVIEVSEWAGLWQAGERYRPGERVLLFLYPPSKLGLTSPVGRGAGRFPVDRTGRVIVKGPAGNRPRAIQIRQIIGSIREAEKE